MKVMMHAIPLAAVIMHICSARVDVLSLEEEMYSEIKFFPDTSLEKNPPLGEYRDVMVAAIDAAAYQCLVPLLETEVEIDDTPTGSADEMNYEAFKDLAHDTPGTCYKYASEGWTYEYCEGERIKQFHHTDDGTTLSYTLGNFENASSKLRYLAAIKLGRGRRQPTMHYSAGTKCDVKRKTKRSAEVKFICDPNATEKKITSVTEVKTCGYVVEVESAAACRLPVIAPPPEPPARDIILCSRMVDVQEERPQFAASLIVNWEEDRYTIKHVPAAEFDEAYGVLFSLVTGPMPDSRRRHVRSTVKRVANTLNTLDRQQPRGSDELEFVHEHTFDDPATSHDHKAYDTALVTKPMGWTDVDTMQKLYGAVLAEINSD